MIDQVLVGTGGSPWSEAAVEYAVQYAADHDAKLIILNVVDTVVFPAGEERRAKGQEVLDRAEEIVKPYGVDATAMLAEGPIVDTIVDVARQTGANVIVLGSKGETGVKERLVGHIISGVLTIAPCPVLVVRQQETLAELLKVGRSKVVFREEASRRR